MHTNILARNILVAISFLCEYLFEVIKAFCHRVQIVHQIQLNNTENRCLNSTQFGFLNKQKILPISLYLKHLKINATNIQVSLKVFLRGTKVTINRIAGIWFIMITTTWVFKQVKIAQNTATESHLLFCDNIVIHQDFLFICQT